MIAKNIDIQFTIQFSIPPKIINNVPLIPKNLTSKTLNLKPKTYAITIHFASGKRRASVSLRYLRVSAAMVSS